MLFTGNVLVYTHIGIKDTHYSNVVGLAQHHSDVYAMYAAQKEDIVVLNETGLACRRLIGLGQEINDCPNHDHYFNYNLGDVTDISLVEYPEGTYLLAIADRKIDCIEAFDLQTYTVISPWIGDCKNVGFQIEGMHFKNVELRNPASLNFANYSKALYFTTKVNNYHLLLAANFNTEKVTEVYYGISNLVIRSESLADENWFSIHENYLVVIYQSTVHLLNRLDNKSVTVRYYDTNYDIIRLSIGTLILKSTTVYHLQDDGTEEQVIVTPSTGSSLSSPIHSCRKFFKITELSFGCSVDNLIDHYVVTNTADEQSTTASTMTTTMTTTTTQPTTTASSIEPIPHRFTRLTQTLCTTRQIGHYHTIIPENCVYFCAKSSGCKAVSISHHSACQTFTSCEDKVVKEEVESYILS